MYSHTSIAFLSVSAVTAAITLFMVVAIIYSQYEYHAKGIRRERFLSVWRPLFAEYIKGSNPATPAIQPGDVQTFCGLWNYWHASLRGEALAGLNAIGNAVGLGGIALEMMRKGNLANRLLAIIVLGNLRYADAWNELKALTEDADPIVSLTAAQAILQIDPEAAISIVMMRCSSRTDWPLPRIAAMFASTGTSLVSKPLAEACLRAEPPTAARLVRLLHCATIMACETTAQSILKTATDPELIASCLRQLNSSSDHNLICSYWENPVWFVRLQAVRALARISTAEDTPLFIRLLKDESWWVKFRAAEALAAIPTFDLYKWEQIAGKFVEPDLRRVLLQVTETRRSRLS